MKFLHTCITVFLLLSFTMAGCQKDDNYLVKVEAFSVITSGYNGSNSELQITIDTLTLQYPIEASASFKRTDKYTFPDGQDSVKLVISEKATGKKVYERSVKKGEYSISIELIYVNGKLLQKPVAPAENPAGFRLVSYLFLPRVSNYQGDVDIVYFKKYEFVQNGQLKIEKMEELARITAKPYVFSEFLKAPSFPGGRNEINGKIYFLNPVVMFFRSGTNIPYYEEGGFTIRENASIPLPFSTRPQIVGISEAGVAGSTYIENYREIQF